MTLVATYAIRDRDLETLLAEGAPAPRVIGRSAYRGPACVYSSNRRGEVWAPGRRGYTDPATRTSLHQRRPHLRALARLVRRCRWKGGRFTIRPSGLWLWNEEEGKLDQVVEFIIVVSEQRPPATKRRQVGRPTLGRSSKPRRLEPAEPIYPTAEARGVDLCAFCFSADLDETGCRTCRRGNGGYGLKG